MELDRLIPTIEIPEHKPVVLIIYEQLLHAIVTGKLAEGKDSWRRILPSCSASAVNRSAKRCGCLLRTGSLN